MFNFVLDLSNRNVIMTKNKYHLQLLALLLSICATMPIKAQIMADYSTPKDTTYWPVITGSAETLTTERMNKGLVTNPLQAISGQTAGVSVSSTGADRMAMLNSVRVRGTTSIIGGNDPLVIIDGVSSDLITLSSVYPADIESFTILKNATETALYGSRGASGVIEVKTKKGHGGKFHIYYDSNIGFEKVYKNIKMLGRDEYLSNAKRLGLSCNDGGYDTDFPNAITRTGFVQSHHVAFSGGSDQSNYRASLGYVKHNTVIKINEFRNLTAKIDLTQKAFEDLLVVDLGAFVSSQDGSIIADVQKLFYSAAAQNPTFPFNENATGGWKKNSTAWHINPPDALLNDKNDERNYNFSTHLSLNFDLAKLVNLKKALFNLRLFASYTFNSTELSKYTPNYIADDGKAYRSEHKSEKWLGNAVLSYDKKWDVHHLEVKLLTEYQRDKDTGFWTEAKVFASNEFGYNNLGAASSIPYGGTGSNYEKPWLASVMGSVSYSFSEYIKMTVTARGDASSMVNKKHRWGLFPSISTELNVMKIIPKLSDYHFSFLKLRIGNGVSGNLGGISSYYSMPLLKEVGRVMVNNVPTVTMGLFHNRNQDLKWESRATFNIGADMGWLNNRIVLTTEYYRSRTYNMLYLYDVPTPPFVFDKMLANLGSMSNRGFEVGLGVTPIQHKDVELNVNVNLSWQRNKLISLSGDHNGTYMTASNITSIGGLFGAGINGGNNNIIYQIVGQPLGVFYLPHCTGLTKNPDDGTYEYEIEDLDHNGDINIEDGSDRYVAGQATPKMTLGSNISFRYKAFDISLQMNGAFGHKIYNGSALSYMNMGSFPDYNVMKEAPERNIYDQTATDYWLESGNYLQFDYLTVGWNVPVKSKYIRSLRVSCSVNNLATITSYSGNTPMINSYVVDSTLGIDDKRSYPAYRTYSFAISMSF